MIAANDPQEFIPGGRQQALRHPEPPELDDTRVRFEVGDDFLLQRLEKVKLDESAAAVERWQLRKSAAPPPPLLLHNAQSSTFQPDKQERSFLSTTACSQSEDLLVSDSWTPSPKNRRLSDALLGKLLEPDKSDAKQQQKQRKRHATGNGRQPLRLRAPTNTMEEELYVRGNLVVWSRGLSYATDEPGAREVICCYSSGYPLRDAVWCRFYAGAHLPHNDKEDIEQQEHGLDCLCIADTQNLRVYTKDDEDFVTMLPFPVRKLWPTKFGLLLEKDDDSGKDSKAMIYSMTHPLDIVSPVAAAKNGATKLIEADETRVVFTSETMDVCMIFDGDTRLHNVCRVRRVKPQETDMLNKTASMCHTRNVTTYSIQESNRSMFVSPFNSRPISMTSSALSLGLSPLLGPAAALTHSSRCQTPTTPMLKRNSLHRLSRLQSTLRSSCDVSTMDRFPNFENSSCAPGVLGEPTHCLEHIWSETLQEIGSNTPATKVFISEDLLGQCYLCYLVTSRSQLSIVKFDHSNNSNDIVFGMATSISAKDAVDIPHLKMIAILEHTSNVVLYSGLQMVGKLHIGGALAQHAPSPYAVRKHANKLFNSPFPRRSSLLPTSMPADPRFDEHLLSPVLPATCRNALQIAEIGGDASRAVLAGLKDCTDDRLTLAYSDGSYYRVTLPSMAHAPLIEDCLNALRLALPRDMALTLMARWYATRNSPGAEEIAQPEEWRMFVRLLLDLLGYDVSVASASTASCGTSTPSTAQVKRQRQTAEGSTSDWTLLLRDARTTFESIRSNLNLTPSTPMSMGSDDGDTPLHVNTSAVLFSHIRIIHYLLHLVYEDLKLNVLRKNDLLPLAALLSQISADLNLEKYVMHYWRDHPEQLRAYDPHSEQISIDHKTMAKWPLMPDTEPASILDFIYHLCHDDWNEEDVVQGYPVMPNITTRSQNVVRLLVTYLRAGSKESGVTVTAPSGSKSRCKKEMNKMPADVTAETAAHKVVLMLVEMGITSRELETYPLCVNFLLYDALWTCRDKPPTDWCAEAYHLLQRPDLASQAEIIIDAEEAMMKSDIFGEVLPKVTQSRDGTTIDGMEELDTDLLKLRFASDQRVLEARRLLQSSRPVPVAIVQRPDVSDHDFLEEQEKHLYAICTRTMALPIGRGMFTLHTSTPVITEPLAIPPLCLTGKAQPRGTTVELTHIDTPPAMSNWPQFHNGVANGLRISPAAQHIDSTWIAFNKPKHNAETLMEHAGFLMALGLNGHLKQLAVLNRFDYLTKFHEMTSVGILLGLGAAFRGTCNTEVTKMLAVHVEGLLPPTSIELDVPQNLQVASLLGVGLVYQGTAHRRMIEVMLAEIGRPPGPEMENSVDRQSYSLAAGLALGLITLRQGGQPAGLNDLNVPDTLYYYMVGGSKRPLQGTQKEKYKVASFQIREGTSVNLDVTAPGATLALGLMYLGTGNKAVAGWMAPPETQYLLDFVRPDFLMLRTLSRALILWNEIEPEKDWIERQVPDSIRPYCMVEPNQHLDLDYEAMNQAYCNITAGACFALGLKFAGSADEGAFEVLLDYCQMFMSLTAKSIAELAGKPTIETCLNVVLVSAAMVMAGTGELQIMRIVRFLRRRVGLASAAVVTYGSHLAVHMALGLLFLGGGKYTLSNSPASVAALICAFYPKFPTHSNDNRYHLQAFRHLYVLAAEPRLVIPTDIVTGRMCYANLSVVKLNGTTIDIKAPALIPDLNTLYRVSVQDERYWPVVFERERNWEQLLKVLGTSSYIDVKQRAGCLSYTEDKTGFRSEVARTLTQSTVSPWSPAAKSIVAFSSDTIVRLFADHFCEAQSAPGGGGDEEARLQHALTQITYESVVQDKLNTLPLFVELLRIANDPTTPIDVWHLKSVCAFAVKSGSVLVSADWLMTLHQKALGIVDNWEPQLRDELKSYVLKTAPLKASTKLGAYLAFYELPYGLPEPSGDVLTLICTLRECYGCDSEIIDKVLRILGYVR